MRRIAPPFLPSGFTGLRPVASVFVIAGTPAVRRLRAAAGLFTVTVGLLAVGTPLSAQTAPIEIRIHAGPPRDP